VPLPSNEEIAAAKNKRNGGIIDMAASWQQQQQAYRMAAMNSAWHRGVASSGEMAKSGGIKISAAVAIWRKYQRSEK